jgi:hypothetical protein
LGLGISDGTGMMQTILNWLVTDFNVFGEPVQNWMFLFAGIFVTLSAGLIWLDCRARRALRKP